MNQSQQDLAFLLTATEVLKLGLESSSSFPNGILSHNFMMQLQMQKEV